MCLGLAGSPPHRDVLAHSGSEKSLSGATHHSRVPRDNSPDTDGRSGQQNPAAQPHKGTSYPVPTPMSWESSLLYTCPSPGVRKKALVFSAKWGKRQEQQGTALGSAPHGDSKTLEEPLYTKSLKTDIPRLWALLNWMTIKPELLIIIFCLESNQVMYSSPPKKCFTFY